MISYLGEGLNITIYCDHIPGHNWMSYLCWYSVAQNLPDAKVRVVCKRKNVSGNLFLWTKKVGVSFSMHNESNIDQALLLGSEPNLIVPPYCVAVRDFEESQTDPNIIKENVFIENTNLICDAALESFSLFCSYKKGWGYFITDDWINTVECPLSVFALKKFSKKNMPLNEKRIEELWKSSLRLFQAVSGGVLI